MVKNCQIFTNLTGFVIKKWKNDSKVLICFMTDMTCTKFLNYIPLMTKVPTIYKSNMKVIIWKTINLQGFKVGHPKIIIFMYLEVELWIWHNSYLLATWIDHINSIYWLVLRKKYFSLPKRRKKKMTKLEKFAFLDCIKSDEGDELRTWNFGLISLI